MFIPGNNVFNFIAEDFRAVIQSVPFEGSAVGVLDFDAVATTLYLRLEVIDRPGVLAQVAGVFGDNDVSIKSVWQEGEADGATLLLVTHANNEGRQRASVEALRSLDVVQDVAAVIRVEGTGPTPNL